MSDIERRLSHVDHRANGLFVLDPDVDGATRVPPAMTSSTTSFQTAKTRGSAKRLLPRRSASEALALNRLAITRRASSQPIVTPEQTKAPIDADDRRLC